MFLHEVTVVNLWGVCTSQAESTGMMERVNEINSPLSNNSGRDIQTNPIIFSDTGICAMLNQCHKRASHRSNNTRTAGTVEVFSPGA